MRRTAFAAALLLIAAACSSGGTESPSTGAEVTTTTGAPATTTTESAESGFPVVVEADNGPVTVDERPTAIVSLSTVATEMLFEIGAGPQVIAVDDQSNYPSDAPMTDLSGFTPNLEAILSFEPDLVVISFDPGDLVAGLNAADVPVISFGAAIVVDDVYRQIEGLGLATGNHSASIEVNERIAADLAAAVASVGEVGAGISYYHEIDNTLYTATSSTFFGEIYSMFDMVNIADAADEDGAAFGYPQLSSEYIVAADPDIIFLTNTLYGESAETVAARPGWSVLSSVVEDRVVELDSDVASRWGPRIVDFAESVAGVLLSLESA